MAKKCEYCQKPYPDNMKTCPHCQGKGRAKPRAKGDEEVLEIEEGSEINLAPKSPIRTRKLPEREPGKAIPGYHGTQNVEGSEVDLGALPGAGSPGVVMPTSGSEEQQEGSEVNLGSLSAFLPREGAPKVVMPGASGKIPASEKPQMGQSMLSEVRPSADELGDLGPKTLDPRGAKPVVPAQKTMLAGHLDLDIADDASAKKPPVDPKATRVAPPGGQPTMLSEGQVLDIPADPKATQLAGQQGKATQLASSGAPKMTQLAGAEEMEASLTEEAKKTKMAAGAAPKTQLASGTSPTTKLARPEEQDLLNLPERKVETQLAAGGTPMTKLAKPDEQDLLKLPEPPQAGEPDFAATEAQMPPLDEPIGFEPEAAESTEAIVEDKDLETVHAKPPKPRYGRRLLAGGVIGMIVGSAAAVALLLFDVVSLDSIRDMVGLHKPTTPPEVRKVTDDTLEGAVALIEGGKYPEAVAVLGKLPESPDTLSRRGQAKWLQYLRDQSANNAKLSAKDAAVEEARKDLAAAKSAEGDFWLAHIEEVTSGAKAGRDLYSKGAEKYKDNARQVQMFQSAIDRIDSSADAVGPGAWLPGDGQVSPLALFFMLQNTGAAAAATDDGGAEAGADFWRAAKLYKDQKYDEAVDALKRARAAHAKRRFSRLGRSQNPTTDPTEDIFLRSCDQLIYLAQAQKMAKDQGYADVSTAIKAAQDKEGAKTLAAFFDQLKKDKDVIKEDPELKDPIKAMGLLVDSKKKANEALDSIKDALGGNPKDVAAEAAKAIKDYKQKTEELDAIAKLLMPGKYVNDDQPSAVKGVDALVKAKKELDIKFGDLSNKYAIADGIVQGVKKRLTDKQYLAADAGGPDDIFKGVEKLIKEAEAPVVMALQRVTGAMGMVGRNSGGNLAAKIDLSAALASSEASKASYQAILMQSHTPQQMLDLWLPLLQNRDHKAIADGAARDAKRVRMDRGLSGELAALAACVEGLALRNQGKYDEARASIAAAVQGAGKAAWRKYATDAQAELASPAGYYLPQAELFRNERKFSSALAVLNRGAQAFPQGQANGQVLAARAVVNIEMARTAARGKLDRANPAVAAAAKDAQAALAAGATADAHYALGRIAEETGDFAAAHKSYRAAVAAHPGDDRAGSRYRLALARVLLRVPEAAPAEDEAKPAEAKDNKTGQAAPTEFFPVAAALVVAAPADDEDEDRPTPEIDEAIRLADQAIKAGNPEGHLIKGLALARKGYWTEAVLEYSKGLEKLGRDPEQVKGLRFLMDNHPALRIPDGVKPANPLEAEKHYALGLRLYWSRNYEQAEKEFLSAVRYQDQDARYMYFLGLARLAQGRRAFAIESFRRGGMLEQQNRPASATISMTLERVQGPDRLLLNRYRP